MNLSVSASRWEAIVGFCLQIRAGVELANPAPLFHVGVAVGCLWCAASRNVMGVRLGFTHGHARSHTAGDAQHKVQICFRIKGITSKADIMPQAFPR